MIRITKVRLITFLLIFSISAASCGGDKPHDYVLDIRLALAASGPLIQSLPIPQKAKDGLVTDFVDLTSGAVTLKTDLDACGSSKSCKVDAVDKLEATFENVEARGHFGVHPTITKIKNLVKGIISSAKIFFAGTGNVTVEDMNKKVDALKEAMLVSPANPVK